jgi:hypothetical protein
MSQNVTPEKIARNRAGCIGCLGVLVAGVLVMVVSIASNRPSPEQQAANDTRVAGYNAAFACQDKVRERLKAPASARFQAPREARITTSPEGWFEVHSHVDAQNGFGALLRTKYTCSVDTKDNVNFLVMKLEMD